MTGIPLLEITDVRKHFGGLSALDGVNLSLETGKLHAIIGPNGAGKTTFFNVITGTLPVSSGRIRFLGDDITDRPVHQISRRGLARTLQIKSVFGNMTVRENLWIAAQSRDGVFSIFRNWKKCTRAIEKADSICEQLNLTPLADQLAANLSYGDIVLLGIGRGLATEPILRLLDEPLCCMGAAETEQTVEIGPWDVISVPPDVMHGAENIGEEEAWLLAINAGGGTAKSHWHPKLIAEIQAAGGKV